MARIRPGGGDDGDPTTRGHGRRHKGRKPRKHHPRAKHPHTRKHSAPPGLAPEPVSAHSAWPHVAAIPGAISPLTTLDPTTPPAPDPLTLAGAERGPIRETFTTWSRQRDQALNRVWRRPGGLTHLAGL